MKVLMLGWELPPHHTGGMGIVCYQMCKELAKSGADIEFILPYTADFPNINFMKINPTAPAGVDEVIGGNVGSTYDSQYFEYVTRGGKRRGVAMNEHQLAYAAYVTKLVRYGEYDVIHAHDWLTFRAGIAAKQVSGLPLFVHVHATEYDRSGGGKGNPLVREIEYMGLHLADKVFAISQRVKDVIVREYDVDPTKVVVVHNAMVFEDHELYEQGDGNTYAYLEKMKSVGYKIVLSAGRLTLQKGLTHLLQAFQRVVAVYPRSLLLVVGPGEQYLELVELAAELNLSGNVLFTGHVNGTGKAWRDAFRVANIFVMPSISEPFGITPFEAVTYGTPALISRQSGASEILNNCLKVDFWDVDEMANQIGSVLANDDLERTLTDNATLELEHMSWEKPCSTMLEHYSHHISASDNADHEKALWKRTYGEMLDKFRHIRGALYA